MTGTFDLAGGMQVATLEIDRDAGLITVRPLRRRKTYTLPLSAVAAMICGVIIRAELREKRVAKRKKRRA